MVLERQSALPPITVDTRRGPAAGPFLRERPDQKQYGVKEIFNRAKVSTAGWTPAGETGESAVRKALDQVVASRPFYRSQRLCHFLRLIVERMLQEPATGLKEYQIATKVYGRPSSFDPRIDPIVRVEGRRLRAKLEEYYQTEGRNDGFQICLPVGAYLPVIRRRKTSPTALKAAPDPIGNCIRIEPFVVDAPEGDGGRHDGMAEEIVHALYTEGLTVCVSGLNDPDQHVSAGDRAGARGMCPLLGGSVRREAAHIRVLSRLTLKDGQVIWCGSYSRSSGGDAEAAIARTMAADIRQVVSRSQFRSAALRR